MKKLYLLFFLISCRGDTELWIVQSAADKVVETDEVEITWSVSSSVENKNLLLKEPVKFELADPYLTEKKHLKSTRKALQPGEI